jgi:hypothetical protein
MPKKITKISNQVNSQVLFWQGKSYEECGSIVDIVAVKNDLKPLFISITDSKKRIESLKKICQRMKLIFKYKSYKTISEPKYNQIFSSKSNIRYNIYISKDLKLIKRAKKMMPRGFTLNKKYDYKDFNLLFGYPLCCVKKFLEHKSAIKNLKPYIVNKIPFYNNNLLTGTVSNCRLSGYEPCSYTCKKTSQLNKKILLAIKNDVPGYYQFLENYLKKPLLVWISDQRPGFGLLDCLVSIVFDGVLKNNTLRYKKIYPHFPINKSIKFLNSPSKTDLKFLAEGNKLVVGKKHIKVHRNDLLLHKIKRSQHSAILVQPIS